MSFSFTVNDLPVVSIGFPSKSRFARDGNFFNVVAKQTQERWVSSLMKVLIKNYKYD